MDVVWYLYAVAGGDFIKIGTALSVPNRVDDLQVGSPVQVELIAWRLGAKREERTLHKLLKHHRVHGEWFRRDPEVLAAIADWRTDAPPGETARRSTVIFGRPDEYPAQRVKRLKRERMIKDGSLKLGTPQDPEWWTPARRAEAAARGREGGDQGQGASQGGAVRAAAWERQV